MNEQKTILIDPPSGWKYGFPKPASADLRNMNADELNLWLIMNGYPEQEVKLWLKSGKFESPPCRFIG